MSNLPTCSLDDPAHPLVADAPRICTRCHARLCLRKQVLNLAVGNTDEMLCLTCLSECQGQAPEVVLGKLIDYIRKRDCFFKEWQRYRDVAYCPDRDGCLPAVCFRQQQRESLLMSETHRLDLRGVACPMNFVKTKLFLDKLAAGEQVQVLLDAGEPVDSVSSSVEAEGHKLLSRQLATEGHYCLLIQKTAQPG